MGEPCRSVAQAVLGAVDPDGALLRCGLLAGHEGEHRFEMRWRDPDDLGARDAIARMLDSRRADPEFMRRIQDRIVQDQEILRRIAENEGPSCCCNQVTVRLTICPVHPEVSR